MCSNDRILRGLDVGPVPKCSLAEHILPKIKALPRDSVFQVDAETGATQTVYQNLTNSIRLSEGLRKLGLRENDVLAMVCRNCFAADEIVLASWLSGATVAPIRSGMKIAEMKHALGLTEPKFIIVEEEFVESVTSALEEMSLSPTIILTNKGKNSQLSRKCLEDVRVDVDVESYRPPSISSPSTQLVAIMQSSGTTGLPKGVGITHTNLIFQDLSMAKMKIFEHGFTFLQISSFFWVTGVLTYIWCLVSGTKRVLLKDATVGNVLRAIDRHKPEWTFMAPLFLSSITDSPEFDKYDVSSMRMFLVGGSPFLPNIGENLLVKWGREKIRNNYGSTEATGSILSSDGDGADFALGKINPGLQVKVVDTTTGETLPENTVGELCAKSPGVMWGYVKNEKETRAAIDSEGWLHTGDLVYYDESGNVYLVDRIKEMIKVMNMQVSPQEVENVIFSIPGVLEVGVVGVTLDGNEVKLKALVVKEKNSPVTEEDICARVADTLSEYKRLTGGVNFVDSLPKTGSGKTHRKELKNMAQALFTG